MHIRLTSETILVSVRLLSFFMMGNLPLFLFFHVVAFSSLAQTKEEALVADSLIEHGQVIIPYKNEAEALTFDPASSTWVKELTWNKQVQQVKQASGNAAQVSVYSTSVNTPFLWLGKEQFLVILSPKTFFTVEVNGHKKKLVSPGVNTQIRLTPLLKNKDGATIIKVISDKNAGDIDALAYKILVKATPDVHFSTSRVRVFIKYPENYRALYWSYHFRMKNHSKSPRYTSFYRTEEKIRDLSGKAVSEIIYDSTTQSNSKLIDGYLHFFYINPDVYSYKWSAETPYLFLVTSGNFSSRYDASEVISERVGLRMAEVKAGELRINNLPVRFKAVAYAHPPLEAQAPTTEEIRNYLIKLKQHHINTILVYGLPVNNDLYNLADEYGLYLVQYVDADKEQKNEGKINNDLWLRQRLSMLYQIRNRPSLVAWAMDSSTIYIPVPQVSALQDSLKALDTNRPLLTHDERKLVTNLPFSAPKLEQLSAEEFSKIKKEYQPAGMKISKDSSVSVFNVQYFAALDKVVLQWKIMDGEKIVRQGEVDNVNIAPGKSQVVKFPFSFEWIKENNHHLRLEIVQQEDLLWAKKGFVQAWEEFTPHDLQQIKSKP